MSHQESSKPYKSTVLFLVCLVAGIAIGATALWPSDPPDLAIETQPHADRTSQPERAKTNIPTAEPAERSEAPISGHAPQTPIPPLVFRECVAQLCDMGLRTAELAQEDEMEAAQQLNEEVRDLLGQLLAQFSDAGERSLAMVIEMSGNPQADERSPTDNTKLGVLQLLLQADLKRRHQVASGAEDRSRINALVQAILDSMAIGPPTSDMGNRCLHKAPYLRLTHEPSVLHLLQLANDDLFSRPIATNMLLTLWDNINANGERSADELSRLAMLRLDSNDPSEIVAACRQLLKEPRFRAIALSWLRDRKDRQLASEIAHIAAEELPVNDGIAVLGELAPLLDHTRGTYMSLGLRSPHALANAYEERLAANTKPNIRRELIMGVGMLPSGVGLPLAELAFANDPSPEVRIQALYVFTVHATPEAAEQAVNQLLDDPQIANDDSHLGSVVLALQNLEQGDPNRIARLAARLQSLPLAEYSRITLRQILERCLPGGAPTSGG